MRIQKIFIFNMLLLTFFAKGQSYDFSAEPPVHFQLPQSVWQFTKFGNIPVNEYRGLVNISIPIYDLKVDDVDIPLKVDYYSGGVKVNEEASIVGLGWSFNIPTVIQQVKSGNDYYKLTIHQKLPPYQGNPAIPSIEVYSSNYQWNANTDDYIGVGSIQSIPYMTKALAGGSDPTSTDAVIVDETGHLNITNKYRQMLLENGAVDSEPDIFTVNLNGVELKFCREQSDNINIPIGQQSLPVILPLKIINGHTEYKVETIPNPDPDDLIIKGIKITDPSGNIYFFTNVVRNGIATCYVLTYKLDKIITNKGKEINFSYSTITTNVVDHLGITNRYLRRLSPSTNIGPFSGQPGLGNTADLTSFGTSNLLFSYPPATIGNSPDFLGITDTGSFPYTQDYNSKTFLEQITTEKENIFFRYSERTDFTNMKKLDEVEIQNNYNVKVKKIIFSYDYFNTTIITNKFNTGGNPYNGGDNGDTPTNSGEANSGSISNPLTSRLKLLSITEEGNEPYSFEYNATSLPSKSSSSIDYWGFYNGHNNLNGFLDLSVLGYPQCTENSANSFNSNIDLAKAASLEKIIYPTKGYSKFEYELNEFDNLLAYQGANTPIINTGAGLRIKSITNYNYDDSLIGKKSFTYFNGKCIMKRVLTKESEQIWADCTFNQTNTAIVTASNSNCINQSNNIDGDYIGYDKVIIKEEGTVDNGRIEKTFSNNEYTSINPYNQFCNSQYYMDTSFYDNGSILSEQIYDSSEMLKLSKKYSYSNVVAPLDTYGLSIQNDGVRLTDYFGSDHITSQGLTGCNTYTIRHRYLLTFYPIYGKFSRLKEELTTEYFSSGSVSNSIKYDYDFENNLQIKTTTVNGGNPLESKATYYIHASYPTQNIFKLLDYDMEYENGILKSRKDYVYEENSNVIQLKIINLLPEGSTDPTKKIKMFYDLYDNKHNLLQYHRENGNNISIIWGYKQTLPVAKIENLDYASIPQNLILDIQSASDQNDETNLMIALDNLRTDVALSGTMVTTYTQIPLVGVSTITDPKGDKISYTYDPYGKLINVKDKDGNILSENQYNYKPQN